MPAERIHIDTDHMLALYHEGMAVKTLAQSLGVSRTVINHRLRKAGITPRTRSEAERLKWGRMTDAQRAAQTEAAHIAVRGSRQTPASLQRRALARQTVERATPNAVLLHDWLLYRGCALTLERAVGPYNVDLANDRIAVELNGGWTNRAKSLHSERTSYLLNRGLDVIVVLHGPRPLTTGAADEIITHLDIASGHPSGRGQYRMIWGDGQPVPVRKSYGYDVAAVAPCNGPDGRWTVD